MSMSPVRQPFHIFRKDAIHLWPETLVSIALLVAFAWALTQTWLPSDGSFNPANLALPIIKFLLVVSWLVLISRLVHDEELVGDRQFWTTRPYTWYGLFSAKVLYLAVFVCVPFLLTQAWLLHHAGLYPTLLIPGLLKNVLYIALVFLLPLLAIAAVTATFVRYISSVLVGLIYFLAVVVLATYNWLDKLSAPYIDYILGGTLLAMILIALVLQYARRKTLITRLILIATPIVVLLFALLAPANLLNAHRYPDNSVGKATFDPNPLAQQPEGRLFNFQHKVTLAIPVQVTLNGLSDQSSIEVQSSQITIDGPNGLHYVSDWSADPANFNNEQKEYLLPLRIPESVYNSIHDKPVAVHVLLGTRTLNTGTPYSINATETPFPLPGHASCTVSADTGEVECHYPFGNTSFTQVAATVHDGNCLVPGQQSAQAFGVLAPSMTSVGFSPVETVHTAIGIRDHKLPLCPGTRTTFTPAVEGAYGRMSLDIPSITLDPYARRIPVKATQTAPTQP
jgi:hypothetical protein